eukprot:2383076-Prymnesium_polylepis.2
MWVRLRARTPYIPRVSRTLRRSNTDIYGHARLTGRLVVVLGGAECDIGTVTSSLQPSRLVTRV